MKTMRLGMRRFLEKKAREVLKHTNLLHPKIILGLMLVPLLASGCREGRFLESGAVEGLEYKTATQSGVTDMNGTFLYMDGETVTFHVGDIVLGSAPAQSLMTPVDLVAGATDVTNPMVTNMARFLQTLDADMNPENGITITREMREAMAGHMVDFNMSPYNFEYDPNVRMFMDTLNGMYPSGPMRMMVSIEDAQGHLRNTMNNMMSGDFGIMNGTNNMMNGDHIGSNGTDTTPGTSGMMGSGTGTMSSGNGMMR